MEVWEYAPVTSDLPNGRVFVVLGPCKEFPPGHWWELLDLETAEVTAIGEITLRNADAGPSRAKWRRIA